ncbi:rRNA-processing protein UTP23 homolog [Amborella trichopoda]|uniref:UTP23 sensor motif region domain-containing protein n=1 Tax=Amborella trichopoda TaxID=13333 RepID=U5DEQ2_AMBTC|nr:rRNA-processing protein UTP23 homolog [Amborella trichopoda]ERN19922.1 hypothetical protein AMTR_s00071p00094030 [Amborella trichopoda]|eukprot:XP_006858455.1 rRNA-processing protein UTP23 homolog [Amborella trichopoda]
MRVKRQKKSRKSLSFFKACFGFREPFKILCDGTFLHLLHAHGLGDPSVALSNLLGTRTIPSVTRCILGELKRLGNDYSDSLQSARNLPVTRCNHELMQSARNCIEAIIGSNNLDHFFVATQDPYIRKKFQQIPGAPVIFGLRNTLFLDPPSAYQRQFVKSSEDERSHMNEWEQKIVGNSKKQDVEKGVAVSNDAGKEVLVATKSKNNRKGMLDVKDKVRFKRKKAKGPNPLSCKKKKNPEGPSVSQTFVHKFDETSERSRKKRKRKRPNKEKLENPAN